ncbi:MAG: winged helix-turn-helix transcriptional regulator [Bacillaceae bacterium]
MPTSPNDDKKCCICSDFHKTIEFIGRKWVGIIIYSLLDGPKRYYELMEMIDEISDRLLTDRLNELVKEGLVKKSYLEGSLKKVQYELTPSGEALKDVIIAIRNWIELKEQLEKEH